MNLDDGRQFMFYVEIDTLVGRLNLRREELVSISIHGPQSTHVKPFSQASRLLIVHRSGKRRVRIIDVNLENRKTSSIIIDESSFREDCVEEALGGFASHLIIFPYTPLLGEEFLREMENNYIKHVVLESLRNLIINYRLSSTFIILTPEYILYDKLKRLSVMYPLCSPIIRSLDKSDIEHVLKKIRNVLDMMVSEDLLKNDKGGYVPSERLVEQVLKNVSPLKGVEDLEHIFRLYVLGGRTSSLDFVRNIRIGRFIFDVPKLPDPEDFLYAKTNIGIQPMSTRLSIIEFIRDKFNVDREKINVKRFGGILNATYLVEFYKDNEKERIFAKKYLNWSDFKWVVAWLWTLGVKNFSVLATTRMSNEIYFINKLAELGFNTAEILYVDWKEKIILQKFIEGENTVQLMKSKGFQNVGEIAEVLGRLLANLHSKDVTIGDCNPFSFIFTKSGEVYLTDLEQCSFKGLKSWDLTELIFYTIRYLPPDKIEEFSRTLTKSYIEEGGDIEDVKESIQQKYTRLLLPLTPLWIQSKAVQAIQEIVA